jgi:exopolysaccharide biosynthesis polyprenyl glycosylphosphotransferase
VLDAEKVDFTVFCMDGYGGDRVQRMVRACDDRCVKVFLVPSAQGFFKSQEQIEYIGSLPIINIHSTPLDVPKNAALKRAMDIVCSLVLIVVFSPVMISVALGVLVSLGRPIFFKQERVGLMGKPFGMIKFRSMRPGRGTSGGWSTGVDSRKTRFGNLIRRYSLDELPQLFNVLAGSMSLVGPRPEQREFVERFKDEIPLYMVKHYVKPGMTGLAQIKGLRGDTSISERISADISYIEGWSLLLDIQILLKTPFRMLNRSEVYTKGSGENEK